jgi:outer membrane protein
MNQYEKPMVVLPLHGLSFQSPPLFDRSLIQSGVSVGWTLYDFGLRSSRVRVQDALGGAANSALSSAERQVVARTVGAYVRVLAARGVLAAHDQHIASLVAERDRVRQLVTQGKAARVVLLRVEAEALRAGADRISGASQIEVAEQELAQLAELAAGSVHASSLAELRLADTLYAHDTSAVTRAGLVARAFRSSSELQELEQRVRAAQAGVAVARATNRPEVRLSGAYVDRGRLKGDFAAEWQLGMGLSYPVYTGGGRANAVQRATADERAAAQQLRIARLNVEQGIDRALAALREAHARAAAFIGVVAQSVEVVHIEQLSLDVGSGTQAEYLDAEANLLRARASLLEAQYGEITARVELARLVGDLSRDWLARTVETRQ